MGDQGPGQRWEVTPEYHSGSVASWGAVLVVGVIGMTIGTFVLSDELDLERPSLEPLMTAFIVLAVGVGFYWIVRRAVVGNAYVELGADALRVRAGVTVDLWIPYGEILGVEPPPVPIVHWEGLVGYHPASRAARVGAGRDCVQVEVREGRWGRFPVPVVQFSRVWLGVRDPYSLVGELRRRLSDHPGPTGA
jgi:hypothetical protein